MNGGARRASGGAGSTNVPDYQFYQAANQTSRRVPLSPTSMQANARAVPVRTTVVASESASPSTSAIPSRIPMHQAVPANTHYQYVFEFGDDQYNTYEQPPPIEEQIMSPTILTTLLAGLQPRMRTNRVDELSALANLVLRLGTPFGGGLAQGLEPVVVRPTPAQITIATEVLHPETEQDCAICQDTIAVTQDCRKILHCGHWFHKDCIDPWFQQNVQCPICRYDIREYSASGTTNPEEDTE